MNPILHKPSLLSFLIAASLLLSGCGGEKTIDGSSEVAFDNSVEKICKSLGGTERKEFKDAISVVDLSCYGVNTVGRDAKKKLLAQLDGKTVGEVLEMKAKILEEREKKKKELVAQEKEKLEKAKEQLEKAYANYKESKVQIRQFKVIRSRFYHERDGLRYTPFIELTVRNGTKYPVAKVYLSCVLSIPGKSPPLVSDCFSHKIKDGLEPDAETTLKISPYGGGWGNVPKDIIDFDLEITVERIDDKNANPIFDTTSFTKADMDRLESLKGKAK